MNTKYADMHLIDQYQHQILKSVDGAAVCFGAAVVSQTPWHSHQSPTKQNKIQNVESSG